ncbi:unnamed protein product [Angiostrongylus costaricensis]|uniref:Serine/threonine-protein phosphatase n=1 Tax=Angiostrongylus costaricensis TaxID=334426 RepID=A0A0R3PZR4_ANGCS|nr:unnamed protein product [Angiostrongylus costaricensis]
MTSLIIMAKEVFAAQPMMLECTAPINVCGDIHGQLSDLFRIFDLIGWPPTVNYLFLGDYIDRGRWSLETMLLLFSLKPVSTNQFQLKFPENFLLLRGNHETTIVNRIYGFYEDIVRRFGTPRLFNTFQDPPNPSLPLDLLWADPDIKIKQFKFSIRGVSCTFGPDVLQTILDKFGFDCVVRAHQVVQDGYEFFSNRKLITLFSAPHYCGQFDNAAAVMNINKDLLCSFKVAANFLAHP